MAASKVLAGGIGLEGAIVGEAAEFFIDATKAGRGNIILAIDGPEEVQMDCVVLEDGCYRVLYLASVPGIYEVYIEFNGVPIRDDLFIVNIVDPAANKKRKMDEKQQRRSSRTSSRTASKRNSVVLETPAPLPTSFAEKCKADGKGLQRAKVGEVAWFQVATRDAGEGPLMVGIKPKESMMEINVKHNKRHQCYRVDYLVEEKGDHELSVMWGGRHIPGSPFCVKVQK